MENMEFQEWLVGITGLPGLFVTGTDTGVGKTWVGQHLITQLRQQGLSIDARKPAESGWPETAIDQTDAALLSQASGTPLDEVCHYRFKAALSPPRAAELEGERITLKQLVQACHAHHQPERFLYVEGAGGVYSPIAADGLNLDLAARLQLPALLVSPDRVGCINHVLLCIEAMQHRQLPLLGVILNRIEKGPEGMDNRKELKQYTEVPVWYHSSRLAYESNNTASSLYREGCKLGCNA